MNISQKCNCCSKEEVCKFTKSYQYDCNRMNTLDLCETTELSIKCKYFSPITPTIRAIGKENENE